MMKKNLILGIIALVILILIIGAVVIVFKTKNMQKTQELENNSGLEYSEIITESVVADTEINVILETTQTESAPNYAQIALEIPEINLQDSLMIVEAEQANYSGSLQIETIREDYSGTGYLSAFQDGDNIKASFMIPASQHYDITICAYADSPAMNLLLLNNEEIGQFNITESEYFTRVTFSGIYLSAGQADLSIQAIDGKIAIDYFEIANNTEIPVLNYTKQDNLSDSQASPNAKKLMNYLKKNYGKKIISGQYTSLENQTELYDIYYLTGKYPAIRFGDMQGYTANSQIDNGDIISACEAWAERGGIVGLIWNWDAPSGESSVYAEETSFSLADAVPTGHASENETSINYQIDVALLTDAEISAKLENNSISESCALLLRDIDSIANALKPLAEKDIPVLWRPLHEAGGYWFWWGADGSQAYRWLWDILYRRMTEYHNLHNLIWIWNGQNESYLVNNYDIASLDIYLNPEQDFNSQYENFLALYRHTKGKKLLALSECSTVPDINFMFRDNTIWSFCGLWYGEYLESEIYTSKQDMINFYNSEAVITLQDTQEIFN
ncbi:MAG: hypothetical protein K2K06_02850 [Oscillospiraceae bacterium]|nr:hypothetical protein [Oscillospiraceae bacterium]